MLTALLGLSIIKAALIIAYFMHLKFERLSLFLTLFPMLILCIILMLLMFMPDSSPADDDEAAMKRWQLSPSSGRGSALRDRLGPVRHVFSHGRGPKLRARPSAEHWHRAFGLAAILHPGRISDSGVAPQPGVYRQ